MISSGLLESYLEGYIKMNGRSFTVAEISQKLKEKNQNMRLRIHRLKSEYCVYPTSRGEYVFLDPRKWMGLNYLPEKIRKAVARAFFAEINNIEALVLYGSWARGDQDSLSDIELLVICKDWEKKRIEGLARILKKSDKRFEVIVFSEPEMESILNEHGGESLLFIKTAFREGIISFGEYWKEKIKNAKLSKEALLEILSNNLKAIKTSKLLLTPPYDAETIRTACYSGFLRFRTAFLIHAYMKNKLPSRKGMAREFGKQWREFKKIYDCYRREKIGEKYPGKIPVGIVRSFLNYCQRYNGRILREVERHYV